ncbi:putative secreted protein [Corynebacterium striatum]|uniref:N-acetylmuramoyl-L-alanine amidase n=1 Tax=Corynebacterium striatum TaxID=43770 RepID=A0ABC9ZJH0_CORST|nr:N-acetylmuramoyl-L-alanine amidase [Corynebacterium striatum ATCC 6940]GEA42176.1 hypothetical protein Cst04h_03460 [Corynebacterium striatum]STD63193.1 putative secreted protein [Corynebacterium striatum]
MQLRLRRRIVPTKSKWSTPLIAAVTSISMVAAAAFGSNQVLRTQENGSGPIDVSSASTSFGDGETVIVEDAAISAQGEGDGPRAVKQFHRDEPFSMFAVTWKGPRDVAAFVRAKQADGSWTQWYDMDSLSYNNDDPNAVNGTELIYTGTTNDVQVSISNVDLVSGSNLDESFKETEVEPGAAESLPTESAAPSEAAPSEAAPSETSVLDQAAEQAAEQAANPRPAPLPYNVGAIAPVADVEELGAESPEQPADQPAEQPADAANTSVEGMEAVFIDGNAQAGEAIEQTAVTDGMPKVVSRAGWGADESKRCMGPTYDNGVKAMTLHHTAGNNNYTKADAAAQMRGIYQYHAVNLGWCDIGYNVLVDKFGTIYEGRYGGLDKAVQGAHVGGFNSNTWGISMIGNYDQAEPTQAILNSVAEIAGWKAAISNIDPRGYADLRSGGFSGSKFAAGQIAHVPVFHGHRDLHYHTCPGNHTVQHWNEIRNATYKKYQAVKSGSSGNGSWVTPGTGNAGGNTGGNTPPPAAGVQSSLGGTQIPVAVIQAVAGIAAALVAVLLRRSGTSIDGGQKVVGGLTAAEVPTVVNKVVQLSGNPGLQKSWTAILNAFGPVLGLAVGGPDVNAGVVSQLFENGVVLSSKETGTHALVGKVAKTWAENDNSTKLGLPTTDEISTGNGREIRVNFQGGYIQYDPATEKINVFTN